VPRSAATALRKPLVIVKNGQAKSRDGKTVLFLPLGMEHVG